MTTNTTTTTTDRAATLQLCTLWTPMWNGDTALAHEIVTADFRVWFGAADGDPLRDELRGPDAFQAFLDRYRAEHPDITFRNHGEPVVDVDAGRAAVVWTAQAPGRELGGIDAFAVENGRFARCWSVTGARPHLF